MSSRLIKRKITLVSITMASAIVLVTVLAWKSLKPINQKNGFNRDFNSTALQIIEEIKKPDNVTDFAGISNNSIYYKTRDASKMFITDINLKNGRDFKLNLPNTFKNVPGTNCIVDSPYVCITIGNKPIVIIIRPDSVIVSKIPNALFTKSAFISPTTVAFRMFDKMDQIFVKGNLATGELKKEINISEMNNDAGISTDGYFQYDKFSKYLTYVFYYKNEFMCIDTNMNLIYKANTIDTVRTAKSKISLSGKDNIMTNHAPNRLVNGKSSVWNGYLYNNSKLKSDNESTDSFSTNAIIDIYSIKDGKYQTSFYVPRYNGEKVSKFSVGQNKLFAMYNNFIVSYKIPTLKQTLVH